MVQRGSSIKQLMLQSVDRSDFSSLTCQAVGFATVPYVRYIIWAKGPACIMYGGNGGGLNETSFVEYSSGGN